MLSGNIVWRVPMAWRKKLLLTGICCLTIAMVIVSIIRIVVGAPGKAAGDLTWLLLWNAVEMTLGKLGQQTCPTISCCVIAVLRVLSPNFSD